MPTEMGDGSGADLPQTDPSIGEIVLATMQANPGASPGQIAVALVTRAPAPEVAVELVAALFEMVVCAEKGHLYWMELTAGTILAGARRVRARDAVFFGQNAWPLSALLASQPTSVTIDTGRGRQRVWLASAPLKGVAVRQTEAIALGNAMIEAFGGRIVEDRVSAEVMAESFREAKLTERAKKRAQALSEVERLTIEGIADSGLNRARAAMAEAFPGSCAVGDKVHPEDDPTHVFTVVRRVNESWVLIQSDRIGLVGQVEATGWVLTGGRPPIDDLPEDAPRHVGFTDEPALVPQS